MIVDDTASGSLLTTACSLASRSFVVQQSSFGARVAVLLAPLSSVLPAVRLSVSALPPSLPSVHPHDAYTGIHQAATQHWHARQQIHLRHLLQCRDAPQVCCSSVSRQRAPRVIHRYSTHAHAASTSPSWRASIDVLATGATTRSSAISSWSWYARRRAFHDRWRTAARRSKPLVRY